MSLHNSFKWAKLPCVKYFKAINLFTGISHWIPTTVHEGEGTVIIIPHLQMRKLSPAKIKDFPETRQTTSVWSYTLLGPEIFTTSCLFVSSLFPSFCLFLFKDIAACVRICDGLRRHKNNFASLRINCTCLYIDTGQEPVPHHSHFCSFDSRGFVMLSFIVSSF